MPRSSINGLALLPILDQIESDECYTGPIQSYVHKSKRGELIHLRLQLIELSVGTLDDPSFYPDSSRAIYAPGSQSRESDNPIWQDFTDFNGEVVPLDVIFRMKEMEESSDKEWNRRGVVVGDKAWEILQEWYSGLS